MKTTAFILAGYITLILFQPAYIHVADLFCNSCSASNSCQKEYSAQCPRSVCCEKQHSNNNFKPVKDFSPHVYATCEICNPFLFCSHSGFVFVTTFIQSSVLPAEKKISLSANEKVSFTFPHEFWHPPEIS